MAYALVSAGASVLAASDGASVTPAFGQPTVAGNLLILWESVAVSSGSIGAPAAPAGWTSVVTTGTTFNVALRICYKIAAGSDANPTITGLSLARVAGKVAEFSGNTATPVDQSAFGANATVSPVVATAALADTAAGELVIGCAGAGYTTAATKATLAHTFNNGAAATNDNSGAVSTVSHYSYGWGITTGNSAADTDSFAFITTKIAAANTAVASFKVSGAAPPAVIPELVMAPLSH